MKLEYVVRKCFTRRRLVLAIYLCQGDPAVMLAAVPLANGASTKTVSE
jgi:hypothetical protein